MDPKRLNGNPFMIEKMRPELGGDLVRAVARDMERAKKASEEKKQAQKTKEKAAK